MSEITKKQRAELHEAICDVAQAAAELAVIKADSEASYDETDHAYMYVSAASSRLEKALDCIFGGENHG